MGVSGWRDELLCTQRWRSSRDRRVGAVRPDHDEALTLKLKLKSGDDGGRRMGEVEGGEMEEVPGAAR